MFIEIGCCVLALNYCFEHPTLKPRQVWCYEVKIEKRIKPDTLLPDV